MANHFTLSLPKQQCEAMEHFIPGHSSISFTSRNSHIQDLRGCSTDQ